MSPLSLRSNVVFNVLRGGSGAVAAIIVPYVAARHLSVNAFSAWMLIVQIASMILYFEIGAPTAVARFVAQARAGSNESEIVSWSYAGAAVLSGFAVVGAVIALACTIFLPRIFPQLPISEHSNAQMALVILVVGAACALPFNAFGAAFIGASRSDVPSLITAVGKFTGVGFLVVAAHYSPSIISMALGITAGLMISAIVQWIVFHRVWGNKQRRPIIPLRNEIPQIARFCIPFIVWSVAMWIITSAGTLLVGRFEFAALVYYAPIMTLVAFLTGIAQAVFSALMPHAAQLDAKDRSDDLGRLLISCTRLTVFALGLAVSVLTVFGEYLLKAWLGSTGIAQAGWPILVLVLVGQGFRLILQPYATILIATGEQSLVWRTPIYEAVIHLFASALLGWAYGVIGVALGGIVGSIATLFFNIYSNLRITRRVRVKRKSFLFQGIVQPLFHLFPLFVCVAGYFRFQDLKSLFLVALFASFGFAFVVMVSEARRWKS